jgi:HK97 family phage portal protein
VPRRFLPTLRTKSTPAATDLKIDAPEGVDQKVVLSDFYNAFASVGLYGPQQTRPWPVERAVAEAYERLVWVFKSVEAISGHASRLPFRLKDGDDVIDDHPLYRVLNRRANPLETGRQFRKRLSAQILLSKRGAFVEVTRSRGGDIVRMDLLPPGRTRPIPGTGQNLIDRYEVVRQDGSRQSIDAENVRWFREPHPLDPYSGVTPLESAGLSAELDFFTRLYNVSFMKNDGRPGGVLAVDGDMDEDDMDRVEGRFGTGPTEAGKLTVINGKVSYVDLAARPRDMQYSVTAHSAKVEILAAFGVPESVLGYAADRTFANADAELYNFWTITMPPHLDLLATGFDEDSDDSLETFLDTEDVEVLQRTKIARRAESREEYDKGLISPDEYRESAGYDRVDNPQTRALYLPSGKTPIPTSDKDAEALGLGPENTQPPAPGPEESAPAAEGEEAGMAAEEALLAAEEPTAPPAAKPAKRLRLVRGEGKPLLETKASKELVSTPDERAHAKLESALAAALAAMAERFTQRALARLGSPKSRKGTRHWAVEYPEDTRVGTKALDAGKAVDPESWAAEARRAAKPIIDKAATAAANGLMKDFDAADFEMPTALAEAADEISDRVAEAAGRLAERLVAAIEKADGDGRSVEQIAEMVRERAESIPGWADAVAGQAATATTAGARDAAASALNEEEPERNIRKEWMTRSDPKVRSSHAKVHGSKRPVGKPFKIGSALLQFPGDPAGPDDEICNCRCKLDHRSVRTGRYVQPVRVPSSSPYRKPAASEKKGDGMKAMRMVRPGDEPAHSEKRVLALRPGETKRSRVPGQPQRFRHGWVPIGPEPEPEADQRRFATREDDARRSQGQTRSNFVHPVTGAPMGKTEIGDTYEALFEARGAQLLVDRYGGEYRPVAVTGGWQSRNTPLDFHVDGKGGELKSLSSRTKSQKAAIKADEIARKRDAVVEANLQPLLVVQVIDQDAGTVQVYAYEDFASKAVSRMEHLGEYSYSTADFEAAQEKTGHHDKREERAAAAGG